MFKHRQHMRLLLSIIMPIFEKGKNIGICVQRTTSSRPDFHPENCWCVTSVALRPALSV